MWYERIGYEFVEFYDIWDKNNRVWDNEFTDKFAENCCSVIDKK